MIDDRQLLRQFTEQNSQEAFSEVVRRHIGWIYQASLRRTGERHDLAADAVQQVFIALAKHARAVASHESPAGWLYITTRYAASHVLRAESRRSKYESAAMSMMEMEPANEDHEWGEIRPQLDRVMDDLSPRDRTILLQRFFQSMSFAELADAHGVTEDGVRKRLDRALDKLRLRLGRRGISSTAAALGALLGTQASAAAPPAVYALAVAAPTAAAQSSLAFGALYFMSTTKSALVVAGLIGIAATVASVTFAVREVRADQAADVAVASMTRRVELSRARLRQVERSLPADTPSTPAPIPKAVTQESAPTVNPPQVAPSGPGGSTGTARSDGQAFLLQNPGARAMLTEQFRAQAARTHALFYRIANLSPAQIDQFESRLVQQWLDTLEVTPSGINPGQFDLPPSELANLLGPEGLSQWQTFQRERVSDYFAKNLALSVKNAAEPLTADQMVQLVAAVSQNSPEFRAGGSVNPATVDWATALAQAQQTMSPAQWREAQPWLQKTYVDAQFKTIVGTTP